MNKLFLTALLAIGSSLSLSALTINSFSSNVGSGAEPGTARYTFDSAALGSGVVNDTGLSVSFSGGAAVVQGSVDNQYAAPNLSGLNDVGFSDQADGLDATAYLSSGIGSIEFLFNSYQNYIGLLWGSVDDYNTLTFFNDDLGESISITGTDVIGNPDGDQGPDGTTYVNIVFNGAFNRIVATSSNFAFEIENLAIGSVSVPDSSSTVALMGLGLVSLALLRRRQS